MLRLVGVLAVLACACRFHFDVEQADASRDTSIDVVLGHDEDGDGIPDTTDFCPHVADVLNADSDGDQVGDVCDPEPSAANQQWALFAPMTSAIPFAMGPAGAWTINADDYSYIDAAAQVQLIRDSMVANVDVWIGFDAEVIGTGGVQAAIIINGSTTPYWYGELFDGGTEARLSITEFDGSVYAAKSSTLLGTTFPVGATDLHLAARPGDSFTLTSRGLTTTYPTPGYAGDRLIILAFGNHTGRVRYIAIVSSQ